MLVVLFVVVEDRLHRGQLLSYAYVEVICAEQLSRPAVLSIETTSSPCHPCTFTQDYFSLDRCQLPTTHLRLSRGGGHHDYCFPDRTVQPKSCPKTTIRLDEKM